MAAFKTGLDYSLTPTDIFNSYQIKRIKRHYGLTGIAICLKLINEAYKTEGYYLPVNDEVTLDNAEYAGIQESEFLEMIQGFCDAKIFDKNLYNRYHILTSLDIQERYLYVNLKLRRSHLNIREEYRLISEEEYMEALKQKKKQSKKAQKEEEKENEQESENENMDKKTIQARSSKEKTSRTTVPNLFATHEEKGANVAKSALNVTESTENVANSTENVAKSAENDIKIPTMEWNGKEWNEINTPPLTPPTENRRGTNAKAEKEETILPFPKSLPPAERNYAGMVKSLEARNIPINEINAILRLSDYGRIGHPAWQAIYSVANSPGKFRLPGRFIISEITKKK